MNKSTIAIIACLIAFYNSAYCQYESIELYNQVPTNMDVSNSELAFATADTGYMTYNAYLNNTSTLVYLQTVDSGRNWHIIDTVHEVFTVHQMCINDGRGAIVGSSGDLAAIELFNNSLSQKSFHSFPQMTNILSVSIVDKDTIVFYGINIEEQTCLGKIVITDEIPVITEMNIIEPCYNQTLRFFNSESGWYLTGSALVYTEDLGLTESRHINEVYYFDFYDSQHGVIFPGEDYRVKFTEDGGMNWIVSSSEMHTGLDGILMTSANTAHLSTTWTGNSGGTSYVVFSLGEEYLHIAVYVTYFGSPIFSRGYSFESQTYWIDTNYHLTFSLNNECYNEVKGDNIYVDDISLSPVPASDRLKITLSDELSANVKISIINELGQSVYSSDIYFQESTSLDISNLVPGIYTLSLITKNKFTSKRFIKM